MEVVRELVILRHAQAGGCEMGQHDVDRCLTPLGRNQPLKVANKLSAAGFAPQLVICSGSVRTRETLQLAQQDGFAADAEVRFEDGIYECTPSRLLTELSAIDDAFERVLVVGHNPSASDVASHLSAQMRGLHPADYAWLSFEGSWLDIPTARASLKN